MSNDFLSEEFVVREEDEHSMNKERRDLYLISVYHESLLRVCVLYCNLLILIVLFSTKFH